MNIRDPGYPASEKKMTYKREQMSLISCIACIFPGKILLNLLFCSSSGHSKNSVTYVRKQQ